MRGSRAATLVYLSTVTLVAGAVGVVAQPRGDAIATCVDKGVEQAVPAFVARFDELARGCTGRAGHKPSACLADAMVELESSTRTASYAGQLRAALDQLSTRLSKACAGDDGRPYTADDVTLAALDRPQAGSRSFASLAQPDAQTDVILQHQADGKPPSASALRNLIKEDCLPREPIDVWMKQPELQRLMATYQCLAINAGLALARKQLGLAAPPMEKLKFNIVPAPMTYDAGVDRYPIGAPDGINDMGAIPFFAACPRPGLGTCADKPDVFCSLPPGSGSRVDRERCPGPSFSCLETLTGPDGITAADVPRGRLAGGMTTLTFTDVDENVLGDTLVEMKCLVEGVRDRNGNLVTSNFSGTCHDGPRTGVRCNGDSDCDTQVPPRYFCVDGDEYFCRADGIRFSNMDNDPPCGECLIALISGPPRCGTAEPALCIASTCVGGPRDGQICNTSQFRCPGGTCKNLREFVRLTGDEAGMFNPKLGGSGFNLCPFQTRWDLPLNLLNGAGWVAVNAHEPPLNLCLPKSSSVNFMYAYVHEPGQTGMNAYLPVGFFFGKPSAVSIDDVPCANAVAPLSLLLTGQHLYTGVGPIIGISGVSGKNHRGAIAVPAGQRR